jgi:predicted PurR-regulated permease PerM
VVVQQVVENGLAPRVLGSVTGLNPFWVFIAILSGARVGGLLGVVVAVPASVVIKQALEALRNTQVQARQVVLVGTSLPPVPSTSE